MADAPATVQASASAHQMRRGKATKAEKSSAPADQTMATRHRTGSVEEPSGAQK
jgi:hypothetical protein